MNKLRIFVDFAPSADVLRILQDGTAGHALVFPRNPVSSVLAKAERDPLLETAQIAFGQPDPQAVEDARELKWIHVSSSGITRYDNPRFRALMAARGIVVSNSASVYHEACAVHALSFILAQARKLPLALQTRSANGTPVWHAIRGSSGTLRGETALIVGYGTIGKRLAELLHPLGMNVLAYRRKARGDEDLPVITEDQLAHTLSTQADHIINILPESSETRHFFNHSRFSSLKPGAIFYNIGRGATVDQEALLEALRSGRLGAAWLDVTEPEPLPEGHPLWAESKCFMTPHVAGGHVDETKTLVMHFLKNFVRFVQGQPLQDRVM